ncbi:MAG: FAD-dependent oxidoreductase [Anaerolineales bacterium]|nr:FAD-dependent oxidoreductase [Anaerolineales bacterium]
MDYVLYFAGEATSREYSAAQHGAYLTGAAAAKNM